MHKIKRAVIPVAGLATRLYPMNKVVNKTLLPICDNDGRIKPVIIKLLEELDNAGIEKIYLIIGPNEQSLYDKLFTRVTPKILSKLSDEDKEYDQWLTKIGKKVSYVVQEEPLGFGHAVSLTRPMLDEEPVILLLGDTIYKSNETDSCVEQLLSYYDEKEKSIIAIQKLKAEELKYFGTVQGKWEDYKKTKMLLETIVEKPNLEYAMNHLLVDNEFFGNFGQFVLTKDFFNELENLLNLSVDSGEEIQLMDAFDNLIKKTDVYGLLINGKSYDMGNTYAYREVLRKY